MKRILALLVALTTMLLYACSELETSENTGSLEIAPENVYLLTEEMRYDSNGEPYYRNTYTYDDAGRMTSRNYIRFAYDDYEELSYTETYSYNERGHLISFDTDEYSETGIDYQYTYDEDGTVSAYTIKNDMGSTTRYLEYDDKGRFVRSFYLDEKGAEIDILSCIYNETGYAENIKNNTLAVAFFTYNDRGDVIKCVADDIFEYQYEDGVVVSESRLGNLKMWSYQYSNGVLSSVTFETDIEAKFGEFAARSYSLDERGKITKVEYDNGGWIEYKYQEMEVTRDQNDLRFVYFNKLNEPLEIHDYYRDVLSYVLPHVQLDKID